MCEQTDADEDIFFNFVAVAEMSAGTYTSNLL